MSKRFNVLMCKFYKFCICAVVGVIIESFSIAFECNQMSPHWNPNNACPGTDQQTCTCSAVPFERK